MKYSKEDNNPTTTSSWVGGAADFFEDLNSRAALWATTIAPSFPYFLPSLFLTCCAILPTSFGGKGPHLRDDWSHSPFIRRSPS